MNFAANTTTKKNAREKENSLSYRIKPCSLVIISPGVYNLGIGFSVYNAVLMRVDAKRISIFVVIFEVCVCELFNYEKTNFELKIYGFFATSNFNV